MLCWWTPFSHRYYRSVTTCHAIKTKKNKLINLRFRIVLLSPFRHPNNVSVNRAETGMASSRIRRLYRLSCSIDEYLFSIGFPLLHLNWRRIGHARICRHNMFEYVFELAVSGRLSDFMTAKYKVIMYCLCILQYRIKRVHSSSRSPSIPSLFQTNGFQKNWIYLLDWANILKCLRYARVVCLRRILVCSTFVVVVCQRNTNHEEYVKAQRKLIIKSKNGLVP